jgi:hypothetical protein
LRTPLHWIVAAPHQNMEGHGGLSNMTDVRTTV